jgi:hypothetical protein
VRKIFGLEFLSPKVREIDSRFSASRFSANLDLVRKIFVPCNKKTFEIAPNLVRSHFFSSLQILFQSWFISNDYSKHAKAQAFDHHFGRDCSLNQQHSSRTGKRRRWAGISGTSAVSRQQAYQGFDQLRRYVEENAADPKLMQACHLFEDFLHEQQAKASVQAPITQFFKQWLLICVIYSRLSLVFNKLYVRSMNLT